MPIEVRHVSHTYLPGTPFEHAALKDVSFTVQDGEFVGIIGHTGSGKSTLLQILARLIVPTSGQVLIDGVDYTDKKADLPALRRKVGVVFQYPEYQLFEETIEQDIAFGPGKVGVEKEEIPARVKEAMALVELDYDAYAKKSPFELSGGQKRRVAIAGVLAMHPKVLIMDEPTSGLDPAGRENLLALVRRLNREGMTILMVSHNMDNLAENASRILVFRESELVAADTPQAVFSNEQLLKDCSLDMPEAARLCSLLRARGVPVPRGLIRFEEVKAFLLAHFGGRA